jgi:hypothetical protein
MGFLFITTFYKVEKDDNLIGLFKTNKAAYAKNLHQTWDPKHEKTCIIKGDTIQKDLGNHNMP